MKDIDFSHMNDYVVTVHSHDVRLISHTNAEKIRAMSDEELAEWFASQYNDCDLCPDYIYAGNCPDGCKKKWLDWLRQEVSE